MTVKGTMVVYSRIKQLKTISYYETDNLNIPKYLSQIIKIEDDRGFHNGEPNGKHFDKWLRVKHPTLKFKKGCLSTGLLKTQRLDYFNGDFKVNGQRIHLIIEFSKDWEILAITVK
ncbi:MAG: hypothetical protein NTX34_08820 [Cytophagales bacterium]|nr:hypothetical protein [Cytophagales bacterium]